MADTTTCTSCDGEGSITNQHVRHLPGTSEAVHPGVLTADRHIEDDAHTVIVDLTAQAGGLDGILADLARAVGEAGLMDELRVLHANRSHPIRCVQALEALTSERSVMDVLRRTITPDAATALRDQLDDAQLEPDHCHYPQCANYAVDDGWCMSHVDDAGLDDIADDTYLRGA
ncbi:hypothetical protein ACPPVT_07660 [Angustibacter sp. McL0619]|uniref:hypothetical protein n=1 Tax=Angustibacter sp. McL0619 TaxID=3415676 RepID=UPI003CECEC27